MPNDEQTPPPADDLQQRIDRILADLAYFKGAVTSQGVGHQPPTLYAAKYVDDVEFLLGLSGLTKVAPPPVPSELETALAHDDAVRVERKKR